MSIPQALKLTYDDYVLLPEDGKRHEIIDGEHFVTPSPIVRHQQVSLKLSLALFTYARSTKSGEVLSAPMDVVLSDVDIVQPDIIYIANANRAIITAKNIQGAPDIVVEILSPGTRSRDEVLKRKLYERFGVREYWLVDPVKETIRIWRLENGAFVLSAEKTAKSESLGSSVAAGFKLRLSEIFPD